MTTWFTSDQHFGHTNIIRFCDRPFASINEMNAELVRRWNEVVQADDTVYVLGDWALGRLAETLPITGQMAGRLILVAGNHDRCWAPHGPSHVLWEQLYLDAGFDEVLQGTIEVDIAGIPVLACHFPYVGDSHDDSRYSEYRPVDDGRWLLHGHVHGLWRQLDRMVNVGVDVWDYRPVSEHQLADLLRQHREALAYQ